MKNGIIHLNVNLVNEIICTEGYSYTDMTLDKNIFKHNAVLYNNNTFCCIDKNTISIDTIDKDAYYDTDQEKEACCNMYLEKFNILKNDLDNDFITYLKEDVKEIFGSDYIVYFDYKKMDYEGQHIDKYGYKELFKGTFDELMKANGKQLITRIELDLQCIKNIWFSDLEPKHLVVTNNNMTYYFNIRENVLKIYSSKTSQPSAKEYESAAKAFIVKATERWNKEQTEIRQAFGEDYRIYYSI